MEVSPPQWPPKNENPRTATGLGLGGLYGPTQSPPRCTRCTCRLTVHPLTASVPTSHYSMRNHNSGWPLSRQCELPWRFAALLRGTRHVKCYSYHARTSVTVSGGGR